MLDTLINIVRLFRGNENLSRGFTLVEVLAVISILGIIASIATVFVMGITDKAERDVCNANVQRIERDYETHLELESKTHSEVLFSQYLQEYQGAVCPAGGAMSYMDGEVECSVHSHNEVEQDNQDEDRESDSVPFL